MKRVGYRPAFAAAVISASAMLGAILPPSIPMLIYASIANVSVIRLFLAGIVPGLLLTAGYMAVCAAIARRHGYAAAPKATWSARWSATRASVWALIMPLIVLLGIRTGLTTITESAALIVVYALVVGIFIYRGLGVREVGRTFYDAARMSAVILFLLAAAGPFSWLMSELGIAASVAEITLGVSDHPFVILLIVNVLLLLVGKILEPVPALIMFTPTLLPVQAHLGMDPVQFGTMVVLNLMIGMQSPPVGLLLFVTSAIGKVPIGQVMLAVLPFVCWSLAVLVLVCAFPVITLGIGALANGM
jgi:tripartite ATP-independent transporter DctM subunit